ncbi:hypothetical protein OOU_Y34scaffold00595g3 [Pyricularia oryzae Y34]|nr:hypothetical protein OOU_Y34scaffold00595g3 [Pyricularia oryzae Y34]
MYRKGLRMTEIPEGFKAPRPFRPPGQTAVTATAMAARLLNPKVEVEKKQFKRDSQLEAIQQTRHDALVKWYFILAAGPTP